MLEFNVCFYIILVQGVQLLMNATPTSQSVFPAQYKNNKRRLQTPQVVYHARGSSSLDKINVPRHLDGVLGLVASSRLFSHKESSIQYHPRRSTSWCHPRRSTHWLHPRKSTPWHSRREKSPPPATLQEHLVNLSTGQ